MFVEKVDDLVESVSRFMEAPEYWREAVGSHPKYFVHYTETEKFCFGLSKFCAFKGINLTDYVAKLRYTTDGATTQKHISKVVGQPWLPLESIDDTTRNAFKAWFFSFFPETYDLGQIRIISLDMSVVIPIKKEPQTVRVSPDELEKRLKHQNRVGQAGELIAYQYEVERLAALNVREPEKWIDHVSKRNASAGFDIWSHPPRKDTRYIEVKSSTTDPNSFYITQNEIDTLQKHNDEAYLYLVLVTNVREAQGDVVREIQNPIENLESSGTLEAILYKAKFRAG